MRTIIEVHALQNFAPSNLNRDDTGAPKDALFGGTRRARISSQCSKRAIREFFSERQKDGLFGTEELAVRTKRVYDAVATALPHRNREEALAKVEAALSLVDLKSSGEGKTQYLLFLGKSEITRLAQTIDEHWDSIAIGAADASKDNTKGKGKKAAASNENKDLRDRIASTLDGGKAVDLGLFGRMLADMPEKNQNAACQVAHAISTHTVEREFDFYTAVDDLKPGDTSGADMMGTVEFNSACFYRYAVVDWQKLIENLQGDADLAKKGVRAFLEAFVVAEPTGKQNSFAAHNPPEFVAVSIRKNSAPRSLANAFETPVRPDRDESLTRRSATNLISKALVLQTAYGGEGNTFVLNVAGADLNGFGSAVSSLADLLDASVAALEV
jgi:CRISPR system Cascade subunit CasC